MISKFPPAPKAPPPPAPMPVASSTSYSDPRRTFQGGQGGFGSGAYGGKQQQQQQVMGGGQGDYDVGAGSLKAERAGRGDAQGEVGHEDLLALLGAVGGQGGLGQTSGEGSERESQGALKAAEPSSSQTRQEGQQGREETKAEPAPAAETATLDIGDVQALLSQVTYLLPLLACLVGCCLTLAADSERGRDVGRKMKVASECKYVCRRLAGRPETVEVKRFESSEGSEMRMLGLRLTVGKRRREDRLAGEVRGWWWRKAVSGNGSRTGVGKKVECLDG